MSQVSKIIFVLVFLCFTPFVLARAKSGFQDQQGIRIDVPVDGQVRIENGYGSIRTEVWTQKYVLVSATIEGGVTFKRSPVVIQTRDKLLSISIVQTPVDPQAVVHLIVKVPASVQTEVITAKGEIALTGLPVLASLKTDSGNITAELPQPLNADISARTVEGVIRSELDVPLSEGGRSLRRRVGVGDRTLRVNTESGQITLFVSGHVAGPAQEAPPALIGIDKPTTGVGTPASSSGTEEVSEGDVIRVDSQLVSLNMSVIDRETNRGVFGLNQNDFQLFENGAEQSIVRFDASSAPFDLVLLIDLSGSTRDVVKLIRAAALRFVNAARPSDRIAIITFAGEPTLVSPPTLDRERLRQRIETIDTASGDTKLYDATNFALQRVAGSSSSRRTAIVLMSDGLDGTVPGVSGQRGSSLTYKELISRVQEFDGVLYTLWLNTYYEALHPKDTQPEAFDTAHDRMKELAEAGGGVFYEVDKLENLAGAYERVVTDLGTVYSISYRPSNKTRDGSWRAIRVTVNRPAAVARGKRGYYAN
ncbi:MAG TPA: VWA domain-containing protein [Pyrinomonadaceae bacterium]|jgi:VWFA-related protein